MTSLARFAIPWDRDRVFLSLKSLAPEGYVCLISSTLGSEVNRSFLTTTAMIVRAKSNNCHLVETYDN